jgi:hypothetical protein
MVTTNLTSLPGKVWVANPEDVTAYLRKHPDLATVLPDVCLKTRSAFGEFAELRLEVVRDPEIDDPHLSLIVSLPTYDATVGPRLDAVSETFDERLGESDGTLIVTSDFRVLGCHNGL